MKADLDSAHGDRVKHQALTLPRDHPIYQRHIERCAAAHTAYVEAVTPSWEAYQAKERESWPIYSDGVAESERLLIAELEAAGSEGT